MAGLTFSEILAKTPGDRREMSRQVRVVTLKFGTSKKLKLPKAICQSYSMPNGSKRISPGGLKYTTMIEFYEEHKVKVSCSCADHLYRWEYALARKKASYVTYSNGDAALTMNPRNVCGCCKHTIQLYSVLRQKGLIPRIRDLRVPV